MVARSKGHFSKTVEHKRRFRMLLESCLDMAYILAAYRRDAISMIQRIVPEKKNTNRPREVPS